MNNNLKSKTMFNSKNIKSGGGNISPVIGPGNQELKINKITFEKTPFQNEESYNIKLHVETRPIDGTFKGFLKDPNNPNGPRHEGQVGRVRLSPYPYVDKTLPSGIEINRDQEILKAMVFLADTLDMRADLDHITAETVFEYMDECSKLFQNTGYVNVCVGAKEYVNKQTGYTNLDLFLPRISKDGVPMESLDATSSRLIEFDKNNKYHYIKVKGNDNSNGSFEPDSDPSDDFTVF